MKFRSLFESRTENLGVKIYQEDLKRIFNEGERNFHFKWLTDRNFVISINFSFGSNLILDTNVPNTRSDIIFYGKLTESGESGTEIKLSSRSKDFLAILFIGFPLLVLFFQMILKMEILTFFVTFLFFPVVILGLLNLIRGEENRLLKLFKESLNNAEISMQKPSPGS